jgi:hypothetical protein
MKNHNSLGTYEQAKDKQTLLVLILPCYHAKKDKDPFFQPRMAST